MDAAEFGIHVKIRQIRFTLILIPVGVNGDCLDRYIIHIQEMR